MLVPLLVAAHPVEGAPPALQVYPAGVRFDLATGEILEPRPPPEPSPLALRGARDEVLAFQIKLGGVAGQRVAGQRVAGSARGQDQGGAPAAEVGVAIEPFSGPGPGGTPLEAAVFLERPVVVQTPSSRSNIRSLGPGAYPDVLVPLPEEGVALPVGPEPTVLWVDVFIPRSAAAGRHRGALRVGAARLEVEVEVLDVTLPERDVARIGAVSFGGLVAREARDPTQFLRWMQLAHAHHLSIEPMRMLPAVASDGTIDWDGWARRVGPYLDGTAFSRAAGYHGPRADLPIARFMSPLAEWWPSQRTPDKLLPADGAAWSRALHELEVQATARGWFARPAAAEWIIFINALDEPRRPEQMVAFEHYEALIADAHLVDRRHFAFRVDGVLGAPVPGWPDDRKLARLAGLVDLWNHHGDVATAPIATVQAIGARSMFYASNTAGEPAIPPLVVDSAIAGARAWGWIIGRYDLAGALNWEVDFATGCVTNPLCSEGGGVNLDALLIYRGEEVEVPWAVPAGSSGGTLGRATLPRDTPVPSMRLKMLRRGAEDAALLSLVAARDPALARDLVALMVPRALGDDLARGIPGLWPRDADTFERARDAMLDVLAHRSIDSSSRALASAIRPRVPAGRRAGRRWSTAQAVAAGVAMMLGAALWAVVYRRWMGADHTVPHRL